MPIRAASPITAAEFRAARLELGMTQADFGAALGLGKMAIYNMEAGARPITKSTATTVATLLLIATLPPETLHTLPARWRACFPLP